MQHWRRERRMSQLVLAGEAGVTQRHVSFVESGRANPSREMVLALARALDVPLRERNQMLLAAGYAPHYRETGLDEEAMAQVARRSIACSTTRSPTPPSSWTGTGMCCGRTRPRASMFAFLLDGPPPEPAERRPADVHDAAAVRRELRADRRGAGPARAPRGGRRDPGPANARAARRGARPAGDPDGLADARLRDHRARPCSRSGSPSTAST